MELKKAIRLIAPLIIEGVISVRNNSHDRLVEKLHELQFITRNFTTTPDTTTIELQILDFDTFHRLLAGEANKFLLASRVSYERSTQDQTANAAWQTIENYYSAYYGVHYLLRLTGTSLTNIDSRGAKIIENYSYGSLPNIKVPAGLYTTKYDQLSKIFTLTKNTKKTGGSHQEAWQLWEQLIESIRAQADIDPVEYAKISIDLADHKRFITKSTGKYNPPEIRGEINYQFKGGAWVFEKNSEKSIGILQRSIAGIQPPQPLNSATPANLIANNKNIINLAKAVFLHASEKYPKGVCRQLLNKFKNYI